MQIVGLPYESMYSAKTFLLDQILFKICDDKAFSPSLNKFLHDEAFLGGYYKVLNYVKGRIIEEVPASREYIETTYDLSLSDTKMNQYDLSEKLKEIYLSEKYVETTIECQTLIEQGQFHKIQEANSKYNQACIRMTDIKVRTNKDEDAIFKSLERLQSQEDVLKFDFPGIDDHKPSKGQLVGILGGVGSGKSLVAVQWWAKALKAGYKTMMFSLELKEDFCYKRLFNALQWLREDDYQKLSKSDLRGFARRLTQFKDWQLTTVDIQKTAINLDHIEKNIATFRPDVVFIDYAQLLDEDFDPMKNKVSKRLHDMAVMYNVLIVCLLQSNDEGSASNDPPELKHIAFNKSLKMDFDTIIAIKNNPMQGRDLNSHMDFVTRKGRDGIWKRFTYHINGLIIDEKKGNWIYQSSVTITPNNSDSEEDINVVMGTTPVVNPNPQVTQLNKSNLSTRKVFSTKGVN